MKKIKRVYVILLGMAILVTALCINPKQVQADLIVPPKDDFVDSHEEDLIQLGGLECVINGPGGKVVVYKSPENAEVITKLENGTSFLTVTAYRDRDGIFWVKYTDYRNDMTGWVPYDYLSVKYNSISFFKEYEEQIIEEQWRPDDSLIGVKVYGWDYPGSTENRIRTVREDFEGSALYEDEEGRQWVYIFGSEWICLDAPEADFENLYPQGPPERGTGLLQDPSADMDEITPAGEAKEQVVTVGVLIAAVMGATLALLKKMKKK